MYLQYFGLKEPPFSIAPNPRYLFMSERHREALAHLVYGLQGAGGFVVLTGEVGAGKTTLARRFLEEIPKTCRVAYLINPNVSVAELLQTICDEFEIKLEGAGRRSDEHPSIKTLVDAINAFLLSEYAAGRNCVVIVDEAQNLTPEVMEQLRLLTNLETSERKLLQIILIGQPELRELLARHDLRQVDQRVVARYHLDPLEAKDTEHYLAHRLSIAGGQADLFTPTAATAVHAWTQGVPRRINVLADRALLGAYAQSQPQVNEALVNKAAGEVFDINMVKASVTSSTFQGSKALKKPLLWLAGLAALGAAGYAAVNGTGIIKQGNTTPAVAARPAAVSPAPKPIVSDTTTTITSVPSVNQASQAATISSISIAATPPKASLSSLINNVGSTAQQQAPARELLRLWKVTAPEILDQPLISNGLCAAAQQARLACHSAHAGFDVMRANNHPVLVMLSRGSNAAVPVLIEKLDTTTAEVMIGQTHTQVKLDELAPYWQGEFVTLMRPLSTGPKAEPINNLTPGAQGPAVADLLSRLAATGNLPQALNVQLNAATPRYDAAVQAAVRSFQVSHGLTPDGAAGPQTLLRLNALAFRDQPTLVAVTAKKQG